MIIAAQYKSSDGNFYEKPVVVKPEDMPAVVRFLDHLYDTDHPIRYIQNFELMERNKNDKSRADS